MPDKDKTKDDNKESWRMLRGAQAGNCGQIQFREFDLGRITSDGSGVVSEAVIQGAEIINKTLKYASIGLTVATVAIDAYRFGTAVKDDLYIRDHACEIIKELEDSIHELQKLLKSEENSKKGQEIKETIEHLEKILNDVKRTRKVPVKVIKTTSSIAGGWGAGIAGGYGGALAGAKAGVAIGAFFGPIGPAVGGPIGAMIGAFGGGICAGMVGSKAGEYVADKGLETLVDT